MPAHSCLALLSCRLMLLAVVGRWAMLTSAHLVAQLQPAHLAAALVALQGWAALLGKRLRSWLTALQW